MLCVDGIVVTDHVTGLKFHRATTHTNTAYTDPARPAQTWARLV